MTDCGHTLKQKNTKRVLYALLLNLLMMIGEFFVSYLTGSQSIFASAVHDFGDSLALACSFGLQVFAAKPADAKYPFGYARFELLAAVFAGLVIFSTNIFIFYEVFSQIFSTVQEPVTYLPKTMMIVSVFGIVINFLAFKLMHSDESNHERTLSLHFFQDTANWAAVLLGGVLIYFLHWKFIDSVLAVGIAGVMSVRVVKEIGKNLAIFLQRTPHNVDLAFFKQQILQIDGIDCVNSVKVWSLDGVHHVAAIGLEESALKYKAQLLDVCRRFHIIEFFFEFPSESSSQRIHIA